MVTTPSDSTGTGKPAFDVRVAFWLDDHAPRWVAERWWARHARRLAKRLPS